MSSRSVALLAATGVLVVTLLHLFVFPSLSTDGRFWYNAIIRGTMLAMVAIASAIAAHTFGWWSEYVGRAWTLFFVEYALLTASEIFRRTMPDSPASGIAVVVANLAGIGAYVLMARSLTAAGLGGYASRGKKIATVAVALVLAALLCWAPIVSSVKDVQADIANVGDLVSPLADAITFVLVAPLLLTVMALRGGQLFWIFALLTAGTIGWMVNQGAGAILSRVGASEDLIRTGRMTGFAMACFLIAAAAVTQWMATRRAEAI